MQTITIEYNGGFCEPAKDAVDAAKKVRTAVVHTASRRPKIELGGAVQSSSNQAIWMMNFYERNCVGEKCFIARVFAAVEDLNKVAELV